MSDLRKKTELYQKQVLLLSEVKSFTLCPIYSDIATLITSSPYKNQQYNLKYGKSGKSDEKRFDNTKPLCLFNSDCE